jgi:hypothetical protein
MTINMHGLNSNMGNMTVDVPALVSSNAGHLASRTWCAQPPMQGTRQPARGLSSDAGLVTAGERGKGCGARQLAPRHGDGVASGAHFFVFFQSICRCRSPHHPHMQVVFSGVGHSITRNWKCIFRCRRSTRSWKFCQKLTYLYICENILQHKSIHVVFTYPNSTI